jgi:hypothetical protein
LAVLLAFLLWPTTVSAATVTLGTAFTSTAAAATYTTASFTPANNDLLCAFAGVSQSAATGSMTDSLGGAWTAITTRPHGGGVNKTWFFCRNTLSNGAALTVTMDVTGDDGSGALIHVHRISGMTRTGAAAVLQFSGATDGLSGATPAATFSAAAQTGNPTVGMVYNSAVTAANVTEPTGWTEASDNGHATPDRGMETVFRNSGFTGTVITWGSTSGAQFSVITAELDTSAAGGGAALRVPVLTTLGVGR